MQTMCSRREVAAYLKVHSNTIYRWERYGKVPPPKRLKRTQECFYTEADIKILQDYRDATTEGPVRNDEGTQPQPHHDRTDTAPNTTPASRHRNR